jgi:hypothetical protein
VLFLRAPDGRVFDHIVAQPTVTAVPTPAPVVEAQDEKRAQEALATDAQTTETTRKSAAELAAEPPLPPPLGVEPPELKPVVTEQVPAPLAAKEGEAVPAGSPLRGAAAAAAATVVTPTPTPTPTTRAMPTTAPTTGPTPTTTPVGGTAYPPPQPTYQPPPQPTYPQRPQGGGPAQAPPRYVNPPTPKRRWGLIITIVLAVVAVVFGGLAWYGSTLPTKVDPTNHNGQSASTLSGPKITAAHLTTPPSIDGDPSEWPQSAATVDSTDLVFGNESGLAGTWALGWDTQNLYFVVGVKDPQPLPAKASDPSQLFKGDGVSFEFGVAVPQNNDAALEQGDKHVLIGLANLNDGSVVSGINVPKGSVFAPGSKSIQGLRAVARKASEGYVIEAAIPWASLGADDIVGGNEYGMNVNVSDSVPSGAKAGELNAMVSNNPARKGNDAQFRSSWGTLTLQG